MKMPSLRVNRSDLLNSELTSPRKQQEAMAESLKVT